MDNIGHIKKIILVNLVKNRIRGDSNKWSNQCNEQIRARLCIFKVSYVPELLNKCIFEKNFLKLNKIRDIL